MLNAGTFKYAVVKRLYGFFFNFAQLSVMLFYKDFQKEFFVKRSETIIMGVTIFGKIVIIHFELFSKNYLLNICNCFNTRSARDASLAIREKVSCI